MDWESLVRIRLVVAEIGATAILGIMLVIAVLLVVALREEFRRDQGA